MAEGKTLMGIFRPPSDVSSSRCMLQVRRSYAPPPSSLVVLVLLLHLHPSSEISPSPAVPRLAFRPSERGIRRRTLAHALPAAAHRVPHIPPLIDHYQIRVCSGQEICPHATVAQGLRCRTSYCLRPSIVMNLDLGPSTPIPVYPMGGRVTPLASWDHARPSPEVI